MTEKRANEILRTKYPEGRIYKRRSMGGTSSSALAVTFKECGKVYSYQSSSYQEVLTKLGFSILYKHNVEGMEIEKAKLNKEIERGGYEPLLDISHREYVEYTQDELDAMRARIREIDELIKTSYIE